MSNARPGSAVTAATEVSEIGRLLREAAGSIVLPAPARAFLLGVVATRGRNPLVAITAGSGEAEQLFADAREVLGERVEIFPAWETLPFEHLSPSVEVMGVRARALRRFRRGEADLLVTSVRAMLQRVAPTLGSDDPIVLQAGSEVDFDEVVERLSEWGYERVYQVETRGEFAIRGGITDIWPSTEAAPVRFELWGDEIESARRFGVGDQRSHQTIGGSVEIYPCRELRCSAEVVARATELLEAGWGNRSVWERFAEGQVFAGMESWLPWLVPDAVPPADLFADSTVFAIVEPKAVHDRAALLEVEETRLAETLAETWGVGSAGEAAAVGKARLYVSPDDMYGRLKDRPVVELLPVLDVRSLADDQSAGETRSGDGVTPARDGAIDRQSAFRRWQGRSAQALAAEAGRLARDGWTVLVVTPSEKARIVDALTDEGISAAPGESLSDALSELPPPGVWVVSGGYRAGFQLPEARLALLTETDLHGGRSRSAISPRRVADRRAAADSFFADLTPGDYVVHYQHGIGRYAGMVTRTMGGVERDYLFVEYAGDDRLYVPLDQLDSVRKYSGGERPRLSRLGGKDWSKATSRARREAAKVAAELVELYRDRLTAPGHAFGPDTPWQLEMESSFPYMLTPDQARTIEEVKADMESVAPMDRLICGDVGFGKTEIAIRAVFKAVQDGYQAAVLVPTTILAQQHYKTFSERLAPYPVQIEMLSRFLTRKEERRVLDGVAAGRVDILIGTHRLLQGDVSIPNLGLLVVDEEQRFGVAQKEAMKSLRRGVDVLALTATPIPRTLEMSLTGIRDMSTIDTSPEARLPVLTFVGEYDEGAVAAAIRREMLRDGQVFFVHNHVRSIERALEHVRDLVPTARVEAAHGQMSESELEKTMLAFYEGEIDVLVSTTIVESGLDIPTVNTLIVERADLLGLAQLYQLRGRVGRGRERAYAYFFYPERRILSEEAYERLKTIGEETALGSGFAIARKDLEIRGAGNLLGEAQSGHIASVGFDLYCSLVADAVAEQRGMPVPKRVQAKIELPVNAHLPDGYVSQESLRLEAYRRLAAATDRSQVSDVAAEWKDRYGPLPAEAVALVELAEARAECIRAGIEEATFSRGRLHLSPVELTQSQQVRLRRRFPGSIYKAEQKRLLIPENADPGLTSRLIELVADLFPTEEELARRRSRRKEKQRAARGRKAGRGEGVSKPSR